MRKDKILDDLSSTPSKEAWVSNKMVPPDRDVVECGNGNLLGVGNVQQAIECAKSRWLTARPTDSACTRWIKFAVIIYRLSRRATNESMGDTSNTAGIDRGKWCMAQGYWWSLTDSKRTLVCMVPPHRKENVPMVTHWRETGKISHHQQYLTSGLCLLSTHFCATHGTTGPHIHQSGQKNIRSMGNARQCQFLHSHVTSS